MSVVNTPNCWQFTSENSVASGESNQGKSEIHPMYPVANNEAQFFAHHPGGVSTQMTWAGRLVFGALSGDFVDLHQFSQVLAPTIPREQPPILGKISKISSILISQPGFEMPCNLTKIDKSKWAATAFLASYIPSLLVIAIALSCLGCISFSVLVVQVKGMGVLPKHDVLRLGFKQQNWTFQWQK